MGSEQFFHNLAFKYMDARRKQIQSHVNYVLSHCFWLLAMSCNVKQILTMIARTKLL